MYSTGFNDLIVAGAEPIPYIPAEAIQHAVTHGPKLSRDIFVKMAAANSIFIAPVELMSLPVCMHFAITLGGRSFVGRRMVSPAIENGRRTTTRPRLTSATTIDEVDSLDSTMRKHPPRMQRTRRLDSSNF
jgi:hypothetical protein